MDILSTMRTLSLFKNSYDMPLFLWGIKRDIVLNSVYGETKVIKTKKDLSAFIEDTRKQFVIKTVSKKIDADINKDVIRFRFGKTFVKLFYDSQFQLFNSLQLADCQFIKRHNRWLDVKNKVVFDIGGNIGDTAIYFAVNGARHIFVFEPYPYSCRIAQKNLELNRLKNKVTIIQAAVSSKKSKLYIPTQFKNTNGDRLLRFKQGIKVQTYTLSDLVNRFGQNHLAMKMDCEGYEYEIIRHTSRSILAKFDDIIISCHGNNKKGVENIKKKLSESGFAIVDGLPDNSIGAFKKY